MAESLLSNRNLKEFIERLKINDEQRSFLLNELPRMDKKQRLELLEMLTKVFILNQEEEQSLKNLKDNWNKIEDQKIPN